MRGEVGERGGGRGGKSPPFFFIVINPDCENMQRIHAHHRGPWTRQKKKSVFFVGIRQVSLSVTLLSPVGELAGVPVTDLPMAASLEARCSVGSRSKSLDRGGGSFGTGEACSLTAFSSVIST